MRALPERWIFRLAGLVCATALPLSAVAQQTAPQDPQARITEERRSVIVEAVQRVSPSVAAVVIRGTQRVSIFDDPFYREFFGGYFPGASTRRRFEVQSGSAVMISAEGEFLTNQHVVGGADSIELLLPNGETREAEIIGTSAKLDLALLRCDPEGLAPAPLGQAEDLLVGEWLVAVGYPVGGRGVTAESRFRPTVTVGVVSALERSFTPSRQRAGREQLFYPDMIQTDAAINPGNSGGPLANASGEIVGINTFILTDSGGSQGLGFAIPIERALRAADEIRTHGYVRDADFTGLEVYREITPEAARSLGLDEPRGLMVYEPGVAAESGLRRDDVILEVDGKRVDSANEAELALLPRFVGDRVSLGVWRAGSRVVLQLTLKEARIQR
jgi:S1-C subfamily serine protease